MGRGETAHPAIRRQPFVRLPSPLCGLLFTLPALRGGQGGDEPRPLTLLLGCIEAVRPPHPGPPHEWGGEKLPIRPFVDNRSSDCPPRFADLYSPSPLCGEGRVGTNRGLLRFARLHRGLWASPPWPSP